MIKAKLSRYWYDGWAVFKGGPGKDGPGSGHHGHAGRPGEVGGSVPGGGLPPILQGEFTEEQVANIQRLVGDLPASHVATVKGIIQYHNPGGDAGLYNARERVLRINTAYKWDDDYFRHEIGHGVGKFALSGDARRRWKGAYQTAYRSGEGFPTKYAATNADEFFAESYKLYLGSPGKLRKANRQMYDLMEEIFSEES